jgi:hypothetical protein
MAECPAISSDDGVLGSDGTLVIEKVCVEDEQGNYYAPPRSALLIVPPEHQYTFLYQFGAHWIPSADALQSRGAANATMATCDTHGGSLEACSGGPTRPLEFTLSLQENVLSQSSNNGWGPNVRITSNLDLTVLLPSLGLNVAWSASYVTHEY